MKDPVEANVKRITQEMTKFNLNQINTNFSNIMFYAKD